jgi:hypothetical protein
MVGEARASLRQISLLKWRGQEYYRLVEASINTLKPVCGVQCAERGSRRSPAPHTAHRLLHTDTHNSTLGVFDCSNPLRVALIVPTGTKPKGTGARKQEFLLATCSPPLTSGRENSLHSDTEIQREIRHQVVVWRAASRRDYCVGTHLLYCRRCGVG